MIKKLSFGIACAIGTTPLTLIAAENSIEEVLVTGELSKYSALKSDTPVMETSRSVTIVTEDVFIERGALTLENSLNYSAGTLAGQFGFDTRNDAIAIRGQRVPIFQDSLQSEFGNFSNVRPDIFTLEQVEVLKGPASVLYGKGDAGGVVNIISKRPQTEAKHQVGVEVGNFNRKALKLDSTGALSNDDSLAYRVVALKRQSDSQVKFVDEDTTILMPSIKWQNDNTELTFLVNYRKTDSDTSSQFLPIEGTLLDAPSGVKIANDSYFGEPDFNKYNTKGTSYTFLASHRFNDVFSMEFTARDAKAESDYNQGWALIAGGALQRTEALRAVAGDTYVNNIQQGLGFSISQGLLPRTFFAIETESHQKVADLRFRADFNTGNVEHNVLLGLQHQTLDNDLRRKAALAAGALVNDTRLFYNLNNPQYANNNALIEAYISNTSPLDPTTQNLKTATTSKDKGVYLHDQITVDNWHISLGLRHDKVENSSEQYDFKTLATSNDKQSDSATSKSIGVLYEFANGISPYINYAESFNPVIGSDIKGNTLKPQRGKQKEVGIKYLSDDNKFLITTALFDAKVSNLSDPNAPPGTKVQFEGDATSKGIEVESKWQINDQLNLTLNLTKLDAKDPNKERAIYVAEKQASTWLTYTPSNIEGLKLGVGLRYIGDIYGGEYQSFTLTTPTRLSANARTIADVGASYSQEHWDVSLNVRNLSNKEYYAACISRGDCFVGEERSVVGSFNYKF